MSKIESATLVANHLKQNTTKYAQHIVNKVVEAMNLQIPESEKERARVMYEVFFEYLGDSLETESYRVPEELLKWSKDNAELQASTGRDIYAIISRYPPSRIIVSNLITELCMENGVSVYGTACLIKKINAMFDISINETLMAYGRMRAELESDMLEELAMLSAPLVLVEESTFLIPLAGTMDEFRVNHIEERTLYDAKKSRAKHLIIDFTRTMKDGDWIAHHSRIIELFTNELDIHIVITGVGRDVTPLVARLVEEKENIQTCSSIPEAVDLTRAYTVPTQEHHA